MTAWLTRRPAPPLRPYIDSYVGYRQDGPPAIHRGLPSRHLTCIVSIGERIDVTAQTDPRQAPARYRFVLSGLQARHAVIAPSRTQEGVAVELTPLGCRALLGVPARALWDASYEASDVMGPDADELWERLQPFAAWHERIAVCDEVFTRLLSRGTAVRREVTSAWQLVVSSGGSSGVAEIAAVVGWSRQHLRARFTDEFGLSPKLAARVVRFERARRMLAGDGRGRIAGVAAACGYYDQAHLDLDFAAFAGCSPSQWLREEFPSFQDAEGAGSRHSPA